MPDTIADVGVSPGGRPEVTFPYKGRGLRFEPVNAQGGQPCYYYWVFFVF
jgi:hypothetical protein